MTYEILSNKKGSTTTISFSSNSELVVAGSVGTSVIAKNNEYIPGADITQISWGSDGLWKIWRGNTHILSLDSTGYIDFSGNGLSLTQNANSTIKVENTGNSGFLNMQIKKTPTSSDYLAETIYNSGSGVLNFSNPINSSLVGLL